MLYDIGKDIQKLEQVKSETKKLQDFTNLIMNLKGGLREIWLHCT
jgi:hypothetical protein